MGAVVALAALVPLLGLALHERRADGVRRRLLLGPAPRRRRLVVGGALAAVAVLLGLAAAQPVLAITHDRPARADAEVLFVFDVSGSMQAALSPSSPRRLDRAKALARRIRAALGDVPAGAAGMTDRVLPYLFPSPNARVFDATVDQSVQIELPPPLGRPSPGGRATALSALAAVATRNYFDERATRRVLVVLSDFESNPFVEASLGELFHKPPRIHTIFVRVWNAHEQIWKANGHADPLYVPDPTGARTADSLAAATRGRAFGEGEFDAIVRTARTDIGTGKVRQARIDRARTPIAEWLALAALAPLALVLRARNL
jgi:hypothetical protein